jgi:hypothetical protein
MNNNTIYAKDNKNEFIINAIENGWSVKKISDKEYKFSKKIGSFLNKRTLSLPISKKDYYSII